MKSTYLKPSDEKNQAKESAVKMSKKRKLNELYENDEVMPLGDI